VRASAATDTRNKQGDTLQRSSAAKKLARPRCPEKEEVPPRPTMRKTATGGMSAVGLPFYGIWLKRKIEKQYRGTLSRDVMA